MRSSATRYVIRSACGMGWMVPFAGLAILTVLVSGCNLSDRTDFDGTTRQTRISREPSRDADSQRTDDEPLTEIRLRAEIY